VPSLPSAGTKTWGVVIDAGADQDAGAVVLGVVGGELDAGGGGLDRGGGHGVVPLVVGMRNGVVVAGDGRAGTRAVGEGPQGSPPHQGPPAGRYEAPVGRAPADHGIPVR